MMGVNSPGVLNIETSCHSQRLTEKKVCASQQLPLRIKLMLHMSCCFDVSLSVSGQPIPENRRFSHPGL